MWKWKLLEISLGSLAPHVEAETFRNISILGSLAPHLEAETFRNI
jgi:hypothetical protein